MLALPARTVYGPLAARIAECGGCYCFLVASETRKTGQRALRRELLLGILTVLLQGCRDHADDTPPDSSSNACAERLITHATLYASPDDEVVADATIRIRAGHFVEVKAGATDNAVPAGCTIDAGGRVTTAGFREALRRRDGLS